MVANPLLESDGMVGDRKTALFDQMDRPALRWLAPFVTITPTAAIELDLDAALTRLTDADLDFPIVAKPDIGGRGVGVRLIKDIADLRAYIDRFPRNETAILQRYVAYEAEASVFYERHPVEEHGRITSLTLKYAPFLEGDGHSTLRDLIHRDARARRIAHLYTPRHMQRLDSIIPVGRRVQLTFAGNHARGAICRNGDRFITREMIARFEEIARAIPEFHLGRFDIRCKSIECLQRGEDFAILEVNGIGAEPLNIWDPDLALVDTYIMLLRQTKSLFEIGRANLRYGFRPTPVSKMFQLYRRRNRLVRSYPIGM
jgi:D-alanine-D-alanine ligase-like ATP-grasp enzyme